MMENLAEISPTTKTAPLSNTETASHTNQIRPDQAPVYVEGQPYLLQQFQVSNPGVSVDAAPRFWADEIQALCQTVPELWNAYEGVVYNTGGVVYAVKLDREGGARTILTANRFVTRITAAAEVETNAGGKKMRRKAGDQFNTRRLDNFRKSITTKQPVLAIMSNRCGDGGIRFPEGIQLCPMENFRTTKIWPEKINGRLVYQVEHELLHYKNIWWVPSTVRDSQLAAMDHTAQIQQHLCSTCGQYTREQIYQEMAICVNENCDAVGTDDGKSPDNQALTFHPNFLNRRVVRREEEEDPFTTRKNEVTFKAVRLFEPTPIQTNLLSVGRSTILRKARQTNIDSDCIVTRGIFCERCHRTVTRSDFAGWRCKTRSCNFFVKLSPPISKLLAIVDSRDATVPHEIDDIHRDVIHTEVVSDFPGYMITIFHLAQDCAIICADASEEVLKSPGGPDDQWRDAITEAVGGIRSLKRGINQKTSKLGGMETNHYYTAHGKEYRFGYKIDHKDFSRVTQSEDATYQFLESLTKRVVEHLRRDRNYPFLLDEWLDPNEFMTVGYWPGQRMRAHVDQHTRPPIATYSLGSGEVFAVIPRKDAHFDRTRTGDPDQEDRPAAGTNLGKKFQKIWEQFKSGEKSREQYDEAKQKILDTPDVKPKDMSHALRIHMPHGSACWMVGEAVQYIYQVSSDHSSRSLY